MKAEFKAVATLLQGGKRSAARNKVWTRIHHETGLGAVSARELLFLEDELDKLRQYGRSANRPAVRYSGFYGHS